MMLAATRANNMAEVHSRVCAVVSAGVAMLDLKFNFVRSGGSLSEGGNSWRSRLTLTLSGFGCVAPWEMGTLLPGHRNIYSVRCF